MYALLFMSLRRVQYKRRLVGKLKEDNRQQVEEWYTRRKNGRLRGESVVPPPELDPVQETGWTGVALTVDSRLSTCARAAFA